MKIPDYMLLDGKSLSQLQLIYRLQSISAAAAQLGVNQSTVSHNLERLRRLLDDPLFIKSGRGLVASAKMEAMQGPIEDVLLGLARVAKPLPFEPQSCDREFVLMANGYEHDIVVPSLFRLMIEQAPAVRLRTLISKPVFDPPDFPRVDIELTPRVPLEGSGLVARPWLQDRFVVFYDASVRDAPRDLAEYMAGQHANVQFDQGGGAGRVDNTLSMLSQNRRVVYTAPSFDALGAVLPGTPLLATCPSRLQQGVLSGLQSCELPLQVEPIKFLMVWHVRNRASAEHQWFRRLIRSVASSLPAGPDPVH